MYARSENPYSITRPRIDPARRPAAAARPDGSPDDNDRVEIGPTPLAFQEWQDLGIQPPDLAALRQYRLGRVRAELARRDYAGVLLWDPLNVRYATDSTNMQVWCTHNAARACFVPTEGPVTMFEFDRTQFLSEHLPLVEDIRKVLPVFYFTAGDRVPEFSARFASELDDLLRTRSGSNRRLAVDKMEIEGIAALERLGIQICSGQQMMEHARKIKDANELCAMRCAVASCESSMRIMEGILRPEMTENDIWSVLHAENIRRGGEWIETRLLTSGPRTNPWFQECGPRVIQEGDIVAFDTDLIGPYGYCCDVSRTWICGRTQPTNEQRTLYQIAKEHIDTNAALLRPGLSFLELSAISHRLPEEYVALRYGVLAHGVGLCDEYPAIKYPEVAKNAGYDGVFEPGMTVCVEAYVGAKRGTCGVKLEDQVVITEDGWEPLSTYPFEDAFLA